MLSVLSSSARNFRKLAFDHENHENFPVYGSTFSAPQVDTSPPEWHEVLRARYHHTEGISVHVSVLTIVRDACELLFTVWSFQVIAIQCVYNRPAVFST